VKRSGIERLLVAGGAETPEVAPGVLILDTTDFPEQMKGGVLATRKRFPC
jgi:hypothetical protein